MMLEIEVAQAGRIQWRARWKNDPQKRPPTDDYTMEGAVGRLVMRDLIGIGVRVTILENGKIEGKPWNNPGSFPEGGIR